MTLSRFVLSLLLVEFSQLAQGWWDEGHMLTAAVAARHLKNPDLFQGILRCDPLGDGNFSRIADAASWLDHIKCSSKNMGQSYCRGMANLTALSLLAPFHLAPSTYNPSHANVSKAAEVNELPPDSYRPTAITALKDIRNSFLTQPTSRFSVGFQLRMALHIWGDMHQPLHTADYYSACFQEGDMGGNLVHVNMGATPITNLHALWDAAGGNMPNCWPIPDIDTIAAALESEYSPSSLVQAGRLDPNWNVEAESWGISDSDNYVMDMVKDTNRFVSEFVYTEYLAQAPRDNCTEALEFVYKPSKDYVAKVQKISREQVALGGYRLSSWLNSVTSTIPPSLATCMSSSKIGQPNDIVVISDSDLPTHQRLWLLAAAICLLGWVLGMMTSALISRAARR